MANSQKPNSKVPHVELLTHPASRKLLRDQLKPGSFTESEKMKNHFKKQPDIPEKEEKTEREASYTCSLAVIPSTISKVG